MIKINFLKLSIVALVFALCSSTFDLTINRWGVYSYYTSNYGDRISLTIFLILLAALIANLRDKDVTRKRKFLYSFIVFLYFFILLVGAMFGND